MSGYTSSIDSWQEKHRILDALTAKAERGELTEDELSAAVRIKCDPPGNDDRWESVGTEWILKQTELFSRVVSNPAEFMRAHKDTDWAIPIFVQSAKVLMTITSHEERLAFVTEFCKGNQYLDWIKPALEAEITQAEVAEIMAAGIEECEPFSTRHSGGAANENVAQLFLRAWKNHKGLVYWDFFTPERLEQIIKVAARKAPPPALEIWEELVKRFGATVAEEIVQTAIENIEEFRSFFNTSSLQRLPLPLRIQILWKLRIPAEALGSERMARGILDFVAMTLLLMSDRGEFLELFEALKPELEKLGARQLSRWKIRAAYVPTIFWPFIREVAAKNHFIVGRIGEGKHRGHPQLVVKHGGNMYVEDRFRPFYDLLDPNHPVEPGELVGFYTDRGKWLARNSYGDVYATTFDLLERD